MRGPLPTCLCDDVCDFAVRVKDRQSVHHLRQGEQPAGRVSAQGPLRVEEVGCKELRRCKPLASQTLPQRPAPARCSGAGPAHTASLLSCLGLAIGGAQEHVANGVHQAGGGAFRLVHQPPVLHACRHA